MQGHINQEAAETQLTPDVDEAARFLTALDPEAKTFTFQTFDDEQERKDPKLVRVLHGTLTQHAKTLASLNEKGAGIFVTVNETNGKGRKAENITRARAVFVDLDGAPLDPVIASEPKPHVITETSPRRWHCYWRAKGVPLDRFAELQKTLIERFGGDPSVIDLPRVMRLPGFLHRKGQPFQCRVVSVDGRPPCKMADFPGEKPLPPELLAALDADAGAGIVREPENEWKKLNTAALQNLSAWVPALLPKAKEQSTGAWRVSSKDLGRKLQEDLSISPLGVRDFGAESGMSPIDVVMQYGNKDVGAAADWLRERLGVAKEKPSAKSTATPSLSKLLRNAADLRTKTFDPLRWVVPSYLPEGLTMLGGKPKIGKSWMALMFGATVASGGTCLGQQCEQGDVLALFLEDNDRRLQRRLTTMLGAFKEEWPVRLRYATSWPRLADGGIDLIREWIRSAEKPRLVIIDILERVRKRSTSKQTTQYSDDYEALVELQKLATASQLSILPLHHQRKMAADDLIDTISGTLGIGGAVDAILILGKDDNGNFLYGRGRDLEEFNVIVELDERCRWQVMGRKPEAQPSPERGQIVSALAKAGKPMTVEEIAAAIGKKRANVKNLLVKLHYEGEIDRVATGLYRLPNPQAAMEI